MPSSLKPNAPPWSAKVAGGTPDSDAPEPSLFPPTKQLAPIQTALGSMSGSSLGSNRPQSPFRSLSSSGLLKQRSTDGQPDDPLASGSSWPSSSALPSQSPLDGPGTPGGGRRGTLSKGSKPAARASTWLGNGSVYTAEGEEDDNDERDGLLNGDSGRGQDGDGVVAAKGLRVHVLDEDGEVLRAGEAVGDEEGGFGITIERSCVGGSQRWPTTSRALWLTCPHLLSRRSTPQISSNSIFHRPSSPAYVSRSGRTSRWGLLRVLKARVDLFALQAASLLVSSVFLAYV